MSGDPECLAGRSSRGPCDDERIKPDVVAPGTCVVAPRSSIAPEAAFEFLDSSKLYGAMSGTSMAAPLASGLAALVRQFFLDERGHDPSAALVKAVLCNGARPLTGDGAQLDGLGLPNPEQGFGCLDLAQSLPSESVSLSFIDTLREPFTRHAFSATGRLWRFEVEVMRAGMPLRATLAWTDRAGRHCQQNLALIAELPNSSKRVGNDARAHHRYQTDMVNTVEQVVVPEAGTGRYVFNVLASNLVFVDRPQHWALVLTGGFDGNLVLRANW